jgi:signal transduction histidine kinase
VSTTESRAYRPELAPAEIAAVCRRAFGPQTTVSSAVELGLGSYNSTYLVTIDGRADSVVLRAAPGEDRQFASERHFMRTEYATLPWLGVIAPLLPRVLAADWSHEVIDRDWMIVTRLDGLPAPDGLAGYPREAWGPYFRQLGAGSTFVFELPLEPSPPAGVTVATTFDSPADDLAYTAFTEPGSAANRRLVVRVGSWLAWAAAVIEVAIAIATPLHTQTRLGILGVAAANAVSAYFVRLRQDKIRLAGIDAWGAIGAVIISGGVYYSGSFIDLVPFVYGWAPMVAFALWGRRRAIAHVAFVGVCFAVVLAIRDVPMSINLWFTIMTVIGFNGAVVSWLTDRLRRLVSSEQGARRHAEQVTSQLGATTAHKSDFLANTSHELRAPLNAIVGFADLLHSEAAGPLNARQRTYVEDIRASARRLQTVIDDVLDIAKLEAGRLRVDPQLVAVGPLLDVVARRAREQANGVDVTVTIEPDAELVKADVRRLEQVLTNLAVNGVKFTPPGGHVSLHARSMDGVVQLIVADTGIGILPEQQLRIFDPFHQGTRMLNDRLPEGTGLGLTLAKNLIELHGGRIWVRSKPDEGAEFTVELPAPDSQSDPLTEQVRVGATGAGT